jgi:hypothetical protein
MSDTYNGNSACFQNALTRVLRRCMERSFRRATSES